MTVLPTQYSVNYSEERGKSTDGEPVSQSQTSAGTDHKNYETLFLIPAGPFKNCYDSKLRRPAQQTATWRARERAQEYC